MTEFARINAPRVATILAKLGQIAKSANSQRISDEDVTELLAPVAAQFTATPPAETNVPLTHGESAEISEGRIRKLPALREAPHIHQIAGFVASLPRDQLPSYITHLVNRVCESNS
jgi:hypothetical protein